MSNFWISRFMHFFAPPRPADFCPRPAPLEALARLGASFLRSSTLVWVTPHERSKGTKAKVQPGQKPKGRQLEVGARRAAGVLVSNIWSLSEACLCLLLVCWEIVGLTIFANELPTATDDGQKRKHILYIFKWKLLKYMQIITLICHWWWAKA